MKQSEYSEVVPQLQNLVQRYSIVDILSCLSMACLLERANIHETLDGNIPLDNFEATVKNHDHCADAARGLATLRRQVETGEVEHGG